MQHKKIAPRSERTVDAVGIDVAKSSLSICLHFREGDEYVLEIGNTDSDISGFIEKYLSGFTGKIVMESTGSYHFLVAVMLREALHDARVVNPIATKKYTTSSIRKVKTDPADAHMLAQMALVEKDLPPTFTMTRDALVLRKKLSLAASLKHEATTLTQMLNHHIEAVKKLGAEEGATTRSFVKTVAKLNEQIKKLEAEIVAVTVKNPEEKKRVELLTTIPGVSPFGACVFNHWFTRSKEDGLSAKSYVAYAGLDVSIRESGTWKGKGRLTKRGNNALRAKLHHTAWGASMHDPLFKTHYKYLREECHRSYVESLTIMSRKLATIIYAVLRDEKPFDPTKIFFQTQLRNQPDIQELSPATV